MKPLEFADEIIRGKRLSRNDDLNFFAEADLEELCAGADKIRKALCGDFVELCSVINGRAGACGENCKFCAQSSHNGAGVEKHGFLEKEVILEDCKRHEAKGVHRYSIVTAGKSIGGDLKKECDAYKLLSEKCKIGLCASNGLLSRKEFAVLYESGVRRYHANIETSRRNFPNVCTTHSFDDKLDCIRLAREMGFSICSGGIIGMGETFADRIDMALTLAELSVESIPINSLIPIKGTRYEKLDAITEDEILRTVAMFRFINPTAQIRMAAGRDLLESCGRKAFHSGANAAITGDFLTTSGNKIENDKAMLLEMGFSIKQKSF